MATRSTIAMLNDDGSVTAVYCHWDGYIEHNGRILKEHYTNKDKIEDLLSKGGISSLGENIYPSELDPHDFETPQNGVTVFYHRDMCDELEVRKFPSKSAYMLAIQGNKISQEYNYLFDGEDWLCSLGNSKKFKAFNAKI